MVEFDLKTTLFKKTKTTTIKFLHLRNKAQRNIPNDHLLIKFNYKIYRNKLTYTSDFIDDLFNNNLSSGVDARKKSRANSGVKLCVAISF
jgi:hypothetical protein